MCADHSGKSGAGGGGEGLREMRLEEDEIEAVAAAVAAKIRDMAGIGKIKPRLLTIELAGEYLSRSADSIRYLIKRRKLPVSKIDNRIFLDIHDLDRIIDDSKRVAL
jgi:hypothetical protein